LLFNSFDFFIFFLILLPVYWYTPAKYRRNLLILASFIFYAHWSIPFFFHFFFSVVINYLFYLLYLRFNSRKIIIGIVILNIFNLFLFKYYYLFYDALSYILPSGSEFLKPGTGIIPEIILPLGISFYTFQMIAFHVDRYRKVFTEKIAFLDFTFFVMFFPQLIAGPIMRHDEIFSQINTVKRNTIKTIDMAALFIIAGLFKKVVLADSISRIIDPVFLNPQNFSGFSNFLAYNGFALQILFDFSGYSDIARGLALGLGFRIPKNFRAPFMAQSFSEFWGRWHITLTTWLRDYLYITLGGNRTGKIRYIVNLMITMVLGGLWHGANYTFFIWGFLHGLFLILERMIPFLRPPETEKGNILRRIFRRVILFHLISFSGIFFRNPSLGGALDMIQSLFNVKGLDIKGVNSLVIITLIFIIMHFFENNPFKMKFYFRYKNYILPVAIIVLGFVMISLQSGSTPFIYFQF